MDKYFGSIYREMGFIEALMVHADHVYDRKMLEYAVFFYFVYKNILACALKTMTSYFFVGRTMFFKLGQSIGKCIQ